MALISLHFTLTADNIQDLYGARCFGPSLKHVSRQVERSDEVSTRVSTLETLPTGRFVMLRSNAAAFHEPGGRFSPERGLHGPALLCLSLLRNINFMVFFVRDKGTIMPLHYQILTMLSLYSAIYRGSDPPRTYLWSLGFMRPTTQSLYDYIHVSQQSKRF